MLKKILCTKIEIQFLIKIQLKELGLEYRAQNKVFNSVLVLSN